MEHDMNWSVSAKRLKSFGDAIQPFVVIFSAVGAVVTFAISEHDKAIDRVAELSQPFYQKQLDVYAESSRVVARLAIITKEDPTYRETITRFWELYWGDLALVESQTSEAANYSDEKSVEQLMVAACLKYVSADDPNKCTSTSGTPFEQAITLAHRQRDELQRRWLKGRPAFDWVR
jgi:hypothetical protein